jgi:hypothetical protein
VAKGSLTLSEQIAGIKAALASKRTPRHLRPALRRRLRKLERALKDQSRVSVRRPRFLGWFEF